MSAGEGGTCSTPDTPAPPRAPTNRRLESSIPSRGHPISVQKNPDVRSYDHRLWVASYSGVREDASRGGFRRVTGGWMHTQSPTVLAQQQRNRLRPADTA